MNVTWLDLAEISQPPSALGFDKIKYFVILFFLYFTKLIIPFLEYLIGLLLGPFLICSWTSIDHQLRFQKSIRVGLALFMH